MKSIEKLSEFREKTISKKKINELRNLKKKYFTILDGEGILFEYRTLYDEIPLKD